MKHRASALELDDLVAVAVAAAGSIGVAAAAVAVIGPHSRSLLAFAGAAAVAVAGHLLLRGRTLVGRVVVYGFVVFGVLAALLYHPTEADLTGSRSTVLAATAGTPGWPYLLRGRTDLAGLRLRFPTVALALACIPLAAYVVGVGPGAIISAPTYLYQTGPHVAVIIGQALGPVALILVGYFAFDRSSLLGARVCAVVIALAYALLYLAVATRALALWPVLIFTGAFFAGALNLTRLIIAGTFVSLLALFGAEAALNLRALPDHGLDASLRYLVTQPSAVVGQGVPFHDVLFGAPLTLYVQTHVGHLSFGDFLTSVSPAPSSLTSWAQIAPLLRVNQYIPYSAIGELDNHGLWLLFAFMTVAAAALVAVERLVLSTSERLRGIGLATTLGIAAFFVVQCTEYNLRSVSRVIYYAVVLGVGLRLVSEFADRRNSPAERNW